MKKLLLLSALFIFACSSDDSSSEEVCNENYECNYPLLEVIQNSGLFNCENSPIPSIIYGTQEWTVENACHTTYRDGTPIPQVTDPIQWSTITTGAWCYYNNDPTKGKLYNWFAVVGKHDNNTNTPNKEFAPDGWHVPSLNEFHNLEKYLIENSFNFDCSNNLGQYSYPFGWSDSANNSPPFYAKSISSSSGWDNLGCTDYGYACGSPGYNQETNNSSGFNAKPTGERLMLPDGTAPFTGEGCGFSFWSTSKPNCDPIIIIDDDYQLGCQAYSAFYTRGYSQYSSGGGSDWNRTGKSVRLVRD